MRSYDSGGGIDRPENLEALSQVLLFAAACPSLTHFTWDVGAWETNHRGFVRFVHAAMKAANRPENQTIGEFLKMPKAVQDIARAFANPAFRLQSLTLAGLPVPTVLLLALMDALKTNPTMQHFSVFNCIVGLRALLYAPTALPSPTLDWNR